MNSKTGEIIRPVFESAETTLKNNGGKKEKKAGRTRICLVHAARKKKGENTRNYILSLFFGEPFILSLEEGANNQVLPELPLMLEVPSLTLYPWLVLIATHGE